MVLIIYTKNALNLTNRYGSGQTKSVKGRKGRNGWMEACMTQNYIPLTLLGGNISCLTKDVGFLYSLSCK